MNSLHSSGFYVVYCGNCQLCVSVTFLCVFVCVSVFSSDLIYSYPFSLFHRSYTLYVFYFVFFIFNLSPSSRCPYCPNSLYKTMKPHDQLYYTDNAPSPISKSHHFRHLYRCCCSSPRSEISRSRSISFMSFRLIGNVPQPRASPVLPRRNPPCIVNELVMPCTISPPTR